MVNAHLKNYFSSFLIVSMNAKANFLRCICYISFTNDRIKLDLLQIFVRLLPLNFLLYCYQISCHTILRDGE